MKKHMLTALLGSAALASFGLSAPASAATIILNDIGGVTGSPAELGFKIAASYWEKALKNNVTLHFDVGFEDLGPNILGGTSTSLYTYVPVQAYYDALAAASSSALDAVAVANLQPLSPTGSLDVIVPEYRNTAAHTGVNATGGRVAPDGKPISDTIAVASSVWQALTGQAAATDATIQFSSTFAFDFNPSNGIAAGHYDFIGVAIHEMGHALGFLSGADDFDYSVGGGFPVDDYWWGYSLDLFRYTNADELNWRFNVPSYFSIDGGATAFNGDSYFSTGSNYGDGWQASHWKAPGGCTNFVGIMNPYICSALVDSVTGEDLALLDAIGWDVNIDALANPNYAISTADIYNAAVPEPATWLQMIGGLALLGGVMRGRARKIAFA
ncbi:NF038122 family metalloprotease [Sphingobium sp. H33]|uniref:NF038122 family metalloprotease n=1 Tax=Sphingobium nicotianae TaxID=2782607 RepID=A0A9X1DEJ2_9SPHN|nr:NF038122 family metalloprotease [Sphingobium nicotianae]MBT2188467.1 NF038122 family metalloprotease [Sphingobium nicotianae]